MGQNGGRREGAGRKKGSKNKVSTEQRARALLHGEPPLDVMLFWMRRYHKLAKAEAEKVDAAAVEGAKPGEGAVTEGDVLALADKAMEWATRAANYVHPRLSAVDNSAKLDVGKLTPEEIAIVGPILSKCMARPLAGIAESGSPEDSPSLPATKH
jgi:hypothetical protein